MIPLSPADSVLLVLLIALAPLAPAGLAFVNTGLGRSRSAAQSLLGALCLSAVAAVVYFAFGYCFEGAAASSHPLHLGGVAWDWAGASAPFFWSLGWTGSHASYAAAFQLIAIALVAIIPWGSGADRWSLSAACASTILLAGIVYPLVAHWIWAGGWLAQLGLNFHLGGGFADPGGAATIQALGGFAALSVVWILGPRRGKFPRGGPPSVIPAHHIVYVLFGCFVSLIGWLAFNTAGAILFVRVDGASLALTEVNTFLCACAALLAALLLTRIRFGKPDASLCANAWIGGLVASSAVAALVSPLAALFVGFIAGAALPLAIEFFELRCGIDDPSGGVVVHGLSAVWGLLAVGFLSRAPHGQMLAQLVGVATLLGLVFPSIYLLNWLLNQALRFRTDPQGERIGMDLHELGAGAYPEFVMHTDEFIPH
jgi:Amt family ammonium transporter